MPTIEEQLVVTQAELDSLQEQEGILYQEISILETQIADLNQQISDRQGSIIVEQEKIQQLNMQIQELQNVISVLNERIVTLANMSIPTTSTPYGIKKDDQGLRVWALQRAFNSLGYNLLEDGFFGNGTENTVIEWQNSNGLGADGIFGMQSSKRMAFLFDSQISNLPQGLVRGQMETESGNWIAAVNTLTPGGIDCGYTQRRVLSSDYNNQEVIRRAWDSKYQIQLLANRLKERHDVYITRIAVDTSEYAWRLASLYHNWPYGADVLSKTRISDLSSYWTTVKSASDWPTNIGAKFPNGELVDTPLKWAKFYSLGAPNRDWPGATTKYVTDWI